jgi:serine protease
MKLSLPLLGTILSCLLFFTTNACIAAPLDRTDAGRITNATDRVIVKYRQPAVSTQTVSAMTSQIAQFTGYRLSPLGQTHNKAQILALDRRVPLDELQGLIDQIETYPGVSYAEPDLIMLPTFTPNDPRYSEQWHYYQETGGIALPEAWDITKGEHSVVAVLDTGYRPHHDLESNLLPGYDMISAPMAANDGDARDDDAQDTGDYAPKCGMFQSSWHGTHVAGTVAATGDNGAGVTGVAFNSQVVPVRVLGKCGGYLSDIADGIAWASGAKVNGAPTNPHPAHVINMSLGGYSPICPQTIQAAIDTARLRGTTLVVAAGNDAVDSGKSAPANCDGVIVVAATTLTGELADYSNFGEEVDISAPGSDVLSTHNKGNIEPGEDSFNHESGTSMATPHVSGVVAMLYAVNPELTPLQVEQIVKSTARSFPASCDGCGAGILDAAAAVLKARDIGNDPALILLKKGVPVSNLNGEQGDSLLFAIDIPEDTAKLDFTVSGGRGDTDLYVRFGAEPSLTRYDCRPYLIGNQESCHFTSAKTGRYYAMLHGFTDYSDTTLVANYQLESEKPKPLASYENQTDHPIPDRYFYGVKSPIAVEQTDEFVRLEVEVDIKHSLIHEIFVELLDPEGNSHTLKTFGGADTANLQELYKLNLSGDIAGVWNLRVRDLGSRGNGYIDSWRITFY